MTSKSLTLFLKVFQDRFLIRTRRTREKKKTRENLPFELREREGLTPEVLFPKMLPFKGGFLYPPST